MSPAIRVVTGVVTGAVMDSLMGGETGVLMGKRR